ncbi:MAG: serine/threonine-protein kinase, partial [Myxococcota bacterium]
MSSGLDTDQLSEDELVTRHLSAGPTVVELKPGVAVGRYVIVERIGSGGMGTVYHAYDPRLNRRVALKLLREGGLDAEASGEQRLIREAQALAQLSSANVVQVYEVGTAEVEGRGEVLFLAMEFADGDTLRSWWRQREPSWREVVEVLVAAGRGLLDAHRVGLVHRDFKPANVLVSEDGRVRVVDFGLARVADAGRGGSRDEPLRRASRDSDPDAVSGALHSLSEQLTEHGTVVGTPAYMAPEQHEGDAGDERSDQYAFCVTLFEALYGVRPFRATARKELVACKRELKIRATPGDRRVPGGLRKIVLRGMSPAPDKRWPSVESLLHALESFLARRRRVAIVGGLSVLAAAASASAWSTAIGDPCAETVAPIEAVWSDETRDAVALAFAATEAGGADATWARVAESLDDYAERWRSGRRDACQAHRGGAQSETLLDRRMACLDEALRSLDGVLGALGAADADVVVHADAAAASLPRIERCGDADAMLAEVAPPQDAEVAKAVAAVRDAVAASRALVDAGKLVEGLQRATAAGLLAEETEYRPVIAEAKLVLGKAQARMGDSADAAQSLDDA